MYQYPFFFISDDLGRNRKIADLLSNEQKKDAALKISLYDSLPPPFQHKALYDVLELEKSLTGTVCDVLRANYNVLNTALPKIDHWRLEEKAKRVLGTLRSKGQMMTHPYQDATFPGLLADGSKWGDTPVDSPMVWNDLVLARVSDLHRHVFRFTDTVRTTSQIGESGETMSAVGTFLEAWRTIAREVKEYTRLISSL